MSCLREDKSGLILTVRAVPRASRNEIGDEKDSALRIRLQAPPVDGKANKALLRFLADTLDVAPSRLALLSGETGRNKRVLITGVSVADALRRLGLPRSLDALTVIRSPRKKVAPRFAGLTQ